LLFGAVPASHGQPATTWTQTVLHSFAETSATLPQLVQAPDGNLWGVRGAKGLADETKAWGEIFKITPAGTFTSMHDFTATDGGFGPTNGASLMVGHDGALYGLTSVSFSFSRPRLYRITTDGQFSIVFTFPEHALINAPPIQDAQGNFYGMSNSDGANGKGYLFKYSTTEGFTDVWDCAADSSDCAEASGPLVQGSDGYFYGTSYAGGANKGGSIFSYKPGAALKVIYSCPAFRGGNCNKIQGGLTQVSDGSLWGHSMGGGATQRGDLFRIIPDGNGGGTFEEMLSFVTGGVAQQPKYGSLSLGSDGTFYGGAPSGAIWSDQGAVYQYAPSTQTLTGIWTFPGYSSPELSGLDSDPLQAADGSLWGGGYRGTASTFGGIYKLTPPTALPAVITLTANAPSIKLGESITLTHAVNNAFSTTATLCDAFTFINGTSGDIFTGAKSTSGSTTVTPTKTGVYQFAYTCGGRETATVTVNVDNVPPSIQTTILPNGIVGMAYSSPLTVTGGVAPYTWSIPTGLPLGLSFNTSTGVISGTPTNAGMSNFTVQVSDSQSTPATASASLAITITLPPVAITTTSLAGGRVSAAYTQTLAASGGATPYTWSINSGSLPAGLILDASSGSISGTPTAVATSGFTVKVSDSQATPATATSSLSIAVAAALVTPAITTTVNPTSIAPGGSATFTATVAGTPAATGTVQFRSNGTPIGSPVTLSNSIATLSNQSFATAGSYSITAVYSGDTNYASVTSSAATLTVAVQTPVIAATSSTITISAPGGSGSTTLTLTNFATTPVTITCAGLPAGAACTAGALSGTGTTVLQITTTGATAALALPFESSGSKPLYAMLLPGLVALGGLCSVRKRHRQQLLLVLFLFAAGLGLIGCGGSSSNNNNGTTTPRGTSAVTVTAAAGSQTATLPITVVVQ
jgi:uncharacterized repeat protein (TIGR03803 family)